MNTEIDKRTSPPGQPIDPVTLELIEEELRASGVRTLGGFVLPLEPRQGARLLVKAMRLLGGPGSGNFGHAGRPGQVGGSAPGDGGDVFDRFSTAPYPREVTERELRSIKRDLRRTGRLNDDGTVSVFHATLSDPKDIMREGLIPGKADAPAQDWKAAHSDYATYFHLDRDVAERDVQFGGSVIEARIPVTAEFMRRVLPDEDSSPIPEEGRRIIARGGGAIAIVGGVPRQWLRALGGPGSGNFGHAGRPGQVGGSAPSGSATADSDERSTTVVRRRSDDIAERMGIPSSIINVVNKEPREFSVGNQNFREAGHYNPATGQIEINARNSYHDIMSITDGIVAHEVSHAFYDAARRAQDAEHKEIQNLPPKEYNRLFRASGYVRQEMRAEIHERWPVSAMFYRHLGDSYMETEDEQNLRIPGDPNPNARESRYGANSRLLEKDDGVSAYSTAYWQPNVLKESGGFERALNETLAETTRHQIATNYELLAPRHQRWREFVEDLQKIAKLDKVKAHIGKPK